MIVREHDDWVVVDASGRQVMRRPTDPRLADAPYVVRLGHNLLGVELFEQMQRVRVFIADADGELVAEEVLPLDAPVSPLSGIEVVDRSAGIVDLVFGSGLFVLRIDTDPIETLAQQHISLGAGQEARFEWSRHDGLTLVRQGAVTRLFGIERMIELPGHMRIASSDPLIVHGISGMLRIDRQFLDPWPRSSD